MRLSERMARLGDETAFEPSPELAAFHEELIRLYPALENIDEDDVPPTWAATPRRSDRVMSMDYSWSAPDEMLDELERLARKHKLMFYDPQGPTLRGPEPPTIEPVAPPAREVGRVTLIGVAAVLVAVGAWYASITILSGLVIVVAAFLALMSALTLVHYAHEHLKARSAPVTGA